MTSITWRNRHFLALDVLLVALAAYASFWLRLDSSGLVLRYYEQAIIFMISAVLCTILIFRFNGIYSRYWRYASADELLLLSSSILLAAVATTLVSYVVTISLHLPHIPRSVPVIFLLLLLPAAAGPRYAERLWRQRRPTRARHAPRQPVLVYGAGDAGSLIVREMNQNPHLGLDPVGFIDDDPRKQGVRIHGVAVLGSRADLPRLVAGRQIAQVIIAMPTASGKIVREIVHVCEETGVAVKTIPGLYELLDGAVSVNQLRNIDIEDLLRREPVQIDHTAVVNLLKDRRVLVSGGGGSIGSELCRQVLRCRPSELVLLGHGENSIFEIFHELQRSNPDGVPIKPIIADIRFDRRIRAILAEHQPEIIFHAAAHKHVPLMEDNPSEAVTNNVIGTQNLVEAAVEHNVAHFVMISTDKAVNPTSVMGAAKRVAELIVQETAQTSGRRFVAVRFGNVLGSRGSVVHTFRQQIAAGGPVTVTHPEMQRYFMTIPEAVQLVLQAAALGRGGEIFMLDMGEPVKIVDLARDLIALSGLEEGRDIDIAFTGLRPGEKLYEELFLPDEAYGRTQHEKIFIAVNHNAAQGEQPLRRGLRRLQHAAEVGSTADVIAALQDLVPEYAPNRPPVAAQRTDALPSAVESVASEVIASA